MYIPQERSEKVIVRYGGEDESYLTVGVYKGESQDDERFLVEIICVLSDEFTTTEWVHKEDLYEYTDEKYDEIPTEVQAGL